MKKVKSVFYHVTTPQRWEAIKKEGVLYGIHGSCFGIFNWAELNQSEYRNKYRYTYLSPTPYYEYGSVVLEVRYTPKREDFGIKHNYGFDLPPDMICWQFSVFEPIPLVNVKRWGTIKRFIYGFLHGFIFISISIPILKREIEIGFSEVIQAGKGATK
jgi:hypothetical protein